MDENDLRFAVAMVHNDYRHEKTYISSNNNVRKSKRAVEADDGAAPVTILRCAGEAHAEEFRTTFSAVALRPVFTTSHLV